MRRLVLGTRGSALALWQARHVAGRISALDPALQIEERILKTEGDVQQHAPLAAGDRGVFVRRIEEALLEREIDLAVHSMKDLPTVQPAGLRIAAVPERHDPRDALVTLEGREFAELAPGTVLGTGSLRRRTQLLQARPELRTRPVRGNVDTRMGLVAEGRIDAVVLALAGLERLGLDRVPYRPVSREICLPAVGQGALAIEAREDDEVVCRLVGQLDHEPSRVAVEAERGFLRRLGGGCLAPATAHATVSGASLSVEAVVGDVDGGRLLRGRENGEASGARSVGERLAERLLGEGAGALLDEARAGAAGDGGA